MRKLTFGIYAGTIWNLFAASTVLADNCSSPGDCLQKAGYNAMVAIVGGILGLVSGTFAGDIAQQIILRLPKGVLNVLSANAQIQGSLAVFRNQVDGFKRLGILTEAQATGLINEAKSRLLYPSFENSRITSEYGVRIDPLNSSRQQGHEGIDFGVPVNTSVHAVASGDVVRSEFSDSYGNIVIIDHGLDMVGNRFYSLYAHNTALSVQTGDRVDAGDKISDSGETGERVTGPHVHYEVRVIPSDRPDIGIDNNEFYQAHSVDPLDYRWPDLTLPEPES